ncbi:penicillin-binding protein [Bordetella pertussis]|nr:penicillin-binding protein [Bordetella pertussis]
MTFRRLAGWRRPALAAAVLAGGVVMALLALDRLFPLPRFGSDGAQVVVAADGTPLRTYPSRDGVWRYRSGPARYRRTISKPCSRTRTAGSIGTPASIPSPWRGRAGNGLRTAASSPAARR